MRRSTSPVKSGSSRLLKHLVQFGADENGVLASAVLLKWTNVRMPHFTDRSFGIVFFGWTRKPRFSAHNVAATYNLPDDGGISAKILRT